MASDLSSITSHDGLRLQRRLWLPASAARALVVAVHGFGTHSGRLEVLACDLGARGIATCSYDLRGHGGSEGIPGHLPSFEALTQDLESVLASLEPLLPAVPRFGFGQGLGCLCLISALCEPLCALQGAVLQGPLLGFGKAWSGMRRSTARLLSAVLPRKRLQSGLRAEDLSSEPCAIASLKSDPLLLWRASANWFVRVERAQQQLLQEAGDLRKPLLIQVGTRDEVVRKRRVLDFAAHVNGDCALHWYPGARHLLLEEQECAAVLSNLGEWFEARLQ